MDIDDPSKMERIKAAEMETEVCMYKEVEKRVLVGFTDERRNSENNLASMLHENYIGDDKVNVEQIGEFPIIY
jgi:hypothetical protein